MSAVGKIFTSSLVWLLLILLLAAYLRSYKIDNPVADWHSWRQADTAAVSRNFYKYGFTPLIPKYDDMSNVSDLKVANPQRYRFVEFPIYNSLVYFGYLLWGGVDERVARAVAIGFSLGAVMFLYLLAAKYFGKVTGLLASLVFAVMPFSVYYGRAILPESSLVFFCLGMVYFLDKWIWENKWWLFTIGILFAAAAFLTKPMAIFYGLVLVYSIFKKEGQVWPVSWRYFLLLLGFLPLLAWRVWMQQFPEGIPSSSWLYNSNGIRLRPAFWYWIVGERLGGVMLGAAGFALFIFGILVKPLRGESGFWHMLAVYMGLYLVVFATGNVQHDYYQYLITPVLAVFVSRGVVLLVGTRLEFLQRIWTIPLAIGLLVLTIYLPWMLVKGYYQVNNWAIVKAGREADRILPRDAVVIAPYGGDSAFLYQTNRVGWPVLADSVENLRDKYGANYYIAVSRDADAASVASKYNSLVETGEYAIYDLNSPK